MILQMKFSCVMIMQFQFFTVDNTMTGPMSVP